MSSELEAENARLRTEVETLTAQRNSAQKRAKRYFRKWKELVQEQEAAPTTLKLVVDRLRSDHKYHLKVGDFPGTEEALMRSSLALYIEGLLTSVPKLQREALLKLSTSTDRPPKPQDVVDTMIRWLESQVEYKKESRNDVSYGWGQDGDDDRLRGEQEAYEYALGELKRLSSGSDAFTYR